MARVTVENCVKHIPNRFELVILAAHRTRQISSGAPLTLERDNDKNPVVALREIAEETVTSQMLLGSVLKGYRQHTEMDATEREMAEMLADEQGPLPEELAMVPASESKILETMVEATDFAGAMAEEKETDAEAAE